MARAPASPAVSPSPSSSSPSSPSSPPPAVPSAETQARTIVLAEALDTADPDGQLLGPGQREAAACAARRDSAEAPGGAPGDAALVALRAGHVVDRLAATHPSLARLAQPGPLWRWALAGLPLAALLAGIATDRISDPHRVDLLSWPLLVVVLWNVLVYLGMAALAGVAALRGRARDAGGLPRAARAPLVAALGRRIDLWLARHRGTRARVVRAFYARWNQLAGRLTQQRVARLLHLSAAAWGAGIALSLAARGLVVEYQAGWESTFLDAAGVHRLLDVIFWLPATVFGMAPFGLDEVAALRNFRGAGQAGDRWVLMYVGLLALVVVLPRLLLAAWAGRQVSRLAGRVQADLGSDYFRALLADLRRTRLAVALAVGDADAQAQWLRQLRLVADDPLARQLSLTTSHGDRLQWVEEPMAAQPVDLVLHVAPALPLSGEGAAPLQGEPLALPTAWRGVPVVTLASDQVARTWDIGLVLLKTLAARHPSLRGESGGRLAAEWAARQAARRAQGVALVAAHVAGLARLLDSAALPDDPRAAGQRLAQAQRALFLDLQALHRLDRTTGAALEARLQATGTDLLPAPVLGQPVGAAAGAAAGMGIGGAVDAATGFLSLGAAAALGGLLGAGIGWATAARRNKGAAEGALLQAAGAALLLYLDVANAVRAQPAAGPRRAAWPAHIDRALQARKSMFARIWPRLRGAAPVQGAAGAASAGDEAASPTVAHRVAGPAAGKVAQAELAGALGDALAAVLAAAYPDAPVFELVDDRPPA